SDDWLDTDWQGFGRARPGHGPARAPVIGPGSLGTAVARALRELAYDVGTGTTRGRETAERLGLPVVPLEAGLLSADFVFLHASLEPATVNLIDRRGLSMLPAGAILANTARLGLVDQGAAAEALASDRLGGLGIDARLEQDSPLPG